MAREKCKQEQDPAYVNPPVVGEMVEIEHDPAYVVTT